jgi:hypothetical protein
MTEGKILNRRWTNHSHQILTGNLPVQEIQ